MDAALIVTMRNALPALLDIGRRPSTLEQSKGVRKNVNNPVEHQPCVNPGERDRGICKRLSRIIRGRPETG